MIDDSKFCLDLLGVLHGGTTVKPEQNIVVENGRKDEVDMPLEFYKKVNSARYHVFQLVGRRVDKNADGVFIDQNKNTSHSYPSPVADYIVENVTREVIENIKDRKNALIEFDVNETLKDIYSGEEHGQIGNVIVMVEESVPQKMYRLFICGTFSTESLSSFNGGRMNSDNTIYFEIDRDEAAKMLIDKILWSLDTEAKLHSVGTGNNYQIIRKLTESVFGNNIYVKEAVEKCMLREIEVGTIIDRRKK